MDLEGPQVQAASDFNNSIKPINNDEEQLRENDVLGPENPLISECLFALKKAC